MFYYINLFYKTEKRNSRQTHCSPEAISLINKHLKGGNSGALLEKLDCGKILGDTDERRQGRIYRGWHKDEDGDWEAGEYDAQGKKDGRIVSIWPNGSLSLFQYGEGVGRHGVQRSFYSDGGLLTGYYLNGSEKAWSYLK